jgi:hypothetical protein
MWLGLLLLAAAVGVGLCWLAKPPKPASRSGCRRCTLGAIPDGARYCPSCGEERPMG